MKKIMKKYLLQVIAIAVLFFALSGSLLAQGHQITDVDGNYYNIVTIGSQVWMEENLRTTKYNDNTPIPNITDDIEWGKSSVSDAYCWYNNDISNKVPYGAIYNYGAANSAKLCPTGWHVPHGEYQTLIDYLGGEDVAGGKLKEIGLVHWGSPNTGATNESGFTALPGGLRDSYNLNVAAPFRDLGSGGYIWDISSSFLIMLSSSSAGVGIYPLGDIYATGFSVRCVNDGGTLYTTPSLNTITVSSITPNSAQSGGNITLDGGTSVTARGVCWSTTINPTVSDNHSTNGTGTGSFTSLLTGLTANTIYYVRAYATNSVGTSYGNYFIFTTCPNTVATISGTATVCLNAANPNITFTGANGTAPYTFTYTINGGSNQIVTTSAGNSVTVSVPTGTSGTYTYSLVSAYDVRGSSCSQTQSGSAIVTVNPIPAIMVMTTIVCSGAGFIVTPVNGTNGTVPAGTTYSWAAPTVTGAVTGGAAGAAAANISGTLTNPLNTAQTATYTVSPTSGGCTGVPFTIIVTVNPLPTAPISGGDKSYCQSGTIPTISATVDAGQTVDWYTASTGGNLIISGNTSFTPSAPGTYYAVDSTTTGCVSSIRTPVTVTMNPLPIPTLKSSDADNIFCTGTSVTFTAGGGTSYNFRVGGLSVQNGSSATYTSNSLTNGQVVDVIVTNNNGCISTSAGITNIINALPIATISGTTSVCLNGASPDITFMGASGTAPYTFTYKINSGDNQTVTTTSGNIVTVGAPTGTAGTFVYDLISVHDASSTVCSQAQSGSATVTVTSTNTIDLTSAVGTDAQTKCINTAITNITYSTTGATGATFAGLPTGVTGAWAGNVVTISGSPSVSAGSPYSYTVTLTGGCGTVTSSGTITVTPNNTITLTSAAATTSQTVCINTAITNITYATTGATGATVTGLPAGVTGTWLANVVTISGTPTAAGPFTYTVTLTGGCGAITTTGTLTVTANNTVNRTSPVGTNAQTVCINTAITNITYATTGVTGATVTGLPAGVTGLWAANVVTISGTPTAVGPFTYTVTLTGGCGVMTTTGTITVTANNTVSLTSAAGTNSQTKCINTAITNITYATTGATGATVTGLPAGVTGSWLANVVTISGTPTASGPFTYTVTLTGGCRVITTTGTITVTANNTVNRTSPVGTDAQTVCINTAITNITYATTGATGATVTGLPAGVTGTWLANVVTISGTPTASGPFTYTVTLTGGCGAVTTTGTLTVTANNTVTLTSAAGTDAQTKCINRSEEHT